MRTLWVGYDSAWTAGKRGGLVGAVRDENGAVHELGAPILVDFAAATTQIETWQRETGAASTLVLLDQPTVVRNAGGQRPVENLVAAPVSRRRGGVQPANLGRRDMFGPDAPVWPFVARFGGPADLRWSWPQMGVIETFPVLTLIAFGWLLPDDRPTGRLPKYNPTRQRTFSLVDWQVLCNHVAAAAAAVGLAATETWARKAAALREPHKHDQDRLDACICLLVGLHLGSGQAGLMVGDPTSGCIVVPGSSALLTELRARCAATGRVADEWLWPLSLQTA